METEFKLLKSNPALESMLFTLYPCYGNLSLVP